LTVSRVAGATATESVAASICRWLRRQLAIESLLSRGPSNSGPSHPIY
jgi:hypothetical protein